MKTQNFLIKLTSIVVAGVLICLGVSNNHSSASSQQLLGAGSNSYDARPTFQANHVRYDNGWGDSIQTNWEEDEFPTNISDMSYGRVILNAEESGTYIFQVWYAAGNAYPIKVFANGVEHNYELANTGWANSLGTIDNIVLNEGRNVFIIAMLKWGVINGLVTPSSVTVVKDDAQNVYQAVNSQLLATYLHVASKTIHDHDAVVYTEPLEYNSNPDFKSKAKFIVDASAATKSIDLKYHCTNNTDGIANLEVSINGGTGFDVDFYETANDVLAVKTIASDVLVENGFVSGPNTIEIIKPSDNQEEIGLVSLTLSDIERPLSATTRVEAEAATLNGGKVKTGDSTKWSNSSYIGDIGTKTTLTSPSQISPDLSNVNSLSFTYEADVSGVYYAYVRYGTGIDNTAYMRADVGVWEEVNLLSTEWWDTCRVAIVELYINEGERTITLTGTTNEGGWVNYDFIDVVYKGDISDAEVAYNYAVFFRNETSLGCTAQNVNLIPWAKLKSEYLAIPSGAKEEFATSLDEIILDARARYEVLINKYPTLAADNWLVDGNGDELFETANIANYKHLETSKIMLIIVVITLVSSLIFVLRLNQKKKHN